ncbi:putative holin-like toxin [Sporosarcina luteola]
MVDVTVFETLMLVFTFAALVVAILSSNDKK